MALAAMFAWTEFVIAASPQSRFTKSVIVESSGAPQASSPSAVTPLIAKGRSGDWIKIKIGAGRASDVERAKRNERDQ